MRQSQSKSLKSFFGTLFAHGNPHVGAQSHHRRGTLQSASRVDTGLSVAGTTLQLAKDTGEAASQVPYVKAVAGILSQILKIRDEIQSNKERCDEIIDLVELKSRTVLQSLDTVYRANGAEGFDDLKSDLEAYASYLQVVLRDELEPFKSQSRWRSYINRGKNASDLQKLERELDEFKDRFSIKRQVAISLDARTAVTLLSKPSVSPTTVIPQALPALPKLLIGRDSVVESVAQTILSSSEPRVTVLGQGGMGKTAVGTTVLYDPRIAEAYPTQHIIFSELAPTMELLGTRIADALSIPQAERGIDLVSRIVDYIHRNPHPVLLFIDNLETVWEVETEQPKVDLFLDILSGAGSKLALLVTMRGTQTPKTSFPWTSTFLSGLDMPDSVIVYEKLSGKAADASAHELLNHLSGSPLAIKLFALMVNEGDKPSQLLSSWNARGAQALEIGGNHRLSSLERSIYLSVYSPRIDDTARLVLGLIAMMPGGLSTLQPWFEGFESILPDGTLLQPALRTLRRAALLEEKGDPSRWQMLPPIRQYCLSFVNPTSPTVTSLVRLHIDLIKEHGDYTSSTSQAIILPEMTNVRSLLLYAANLQFPPTFIGAATANYAMWAYWQDIDESAMLLSLLHLPLPTSQQANIYLKLGIVHQHWNRQDSAETSFTRSLELSVECKDRQREGQTHQHLGSLRVRRDQFDAAEASFARALEIFIELQNPLGEANTLFCMGDLHVERDQLDTAEALFTRALDRFVQIQDRLGEANAHNSIGELQVRRDQLVAAETSFSRALELLVAVQDRFGEATTHQSIGELHMRRDDLNSAERSFAHALKLYVEVQNRVGEANVRLSFGKLHLRRDQLASAEEQFARALEAYVDVQDQWSTAYCTFIQGKVCLRRREMDATRVAFTRALSLWKHLDMPRGIAETQQALGDMHLHRDQLDEAETCLNIALDIYTTKVQSRIDEALTNRSIGELHLRRSHFEESERSFRLALELDIAASSRVGQAESHRLLGGMFLKKADLGLAELSYIESLRLFLEIGGYQATPCLVDLGRVWVLRGKIGDNEALDAEVLRARWDAVEAR